MRAIIVAALLFVGCNQPAPQRHWPNVEMEAPISGSFSAVISVESDDDARRVRARWDGAYLYLFVPIGVPGLVPSALIETPGDGTRVCAVAVEDVDGWLAFSGSCVAGRVRMP